MGDTKISYKNFRLIDVEIGDIASGLFMIVENGQVKDLTTQPGRGNHISLDDKFILPGLIDAHVHLVWEGQSDPNRHMVSDSIPTTAYRAARSVRRNLKGGVTTVRDVGGPHGITIALADAISHDRVKGSRVLAAGSPVAQTGGHVYTMAREADGTEEIRKAVREQIKAGAHLIKLMCSGGAYGHGESIHSTQLTPGEICAAVEEAHAAERKVAAHALPAQAIQNCLEAGVDTIEHAALLSEQNIEAFRRTQAFMVPTVAPYYLMATQGQDRGVPDYAIEKSKMVMDHYFSSLKTAKKAGVNLCMGTDAGSPSLPHPTLPYEAWLWHTQAGLDPLSVLAAATIGSARALGKERSLGRLNPGYWADFVVYEKNPLEDIRILHFPLSVYKGGEKVTTDGPVWSLTLTSE